MGETPVTEVLLHLRLAWGRGERPTLEALLDAHPHLKTSPEAVLDLIYTEVLLRERAGETPTLEDYAPRFPSLATELKEQFEVTGAFAEVPLGSRTTVPHATGRGKATDLPRLEGYDLLEELGRGAMGTVYRGWQQAAKRHVAVKLLSGYVTPERAGTEVEAASRLKHPHIVAVYDVKSHEGRIAIVMEYVEGIDLAKRLDRKPVAPAVAAHLVERLAEAMAYAHSRGVLHRDLKPSNVLLSGAKDDPLSTGDSKIADFGLAKVLGADSGLTKSGEVIGSPPYMAPEQAMGDKNVGPLADVYGLGAILYECLTGRPPFQAETQLDTLTLVVGQDPVKPRSLNPKVPRDLETICLKCLEKAPARRYGSAMEFADDLRRFQVGQPIRARPVGSLERVWRWARRNPGWASTVSVLALLAVVAGIAYVNWQQRRQEQQAKARYQLEAQCMTLHMRLGHAVVEAYEVGREVGRRDAFQVLSEVEALAEEYPKDSLVLQLLGQSYARCGDLVGTPEKRLSFLDNFLKPTADIFFGLGEKQRAGLEEQLRYYDQAAAIYHRIEADWSMERSARMPLSNYHAVRSKLLFRLLRSSESLEALSLALRYEDDSVRSAQIGLVQNTVMFAAVGEQAKLPWSRPPRVDHAKAVRLAALLAATPHVPSAALYNAACAHALATGEPGIPDSERDRRAAQAVAYLQKIEQDGYFRVPKKRKELGEDTDLDALRRRTDFEELLRKVNAE
jgi:hypothetical protein